MSNQFFRAIAQITPGSEAGSPIRFVASTDQVARDGFIVDMAGWRLDNYRSNPVFLWAHDYASPPIGRADVFVEQGVMNADVIFDQADEFARSIERKYRDGFLSAVSVGFNALAFNPPQRNGDAPHITEAELLDISAVPVPSDPRALKGRKRDALGAYLKELETGDEAEAVEPTWEQTAIEMMRLFDPEAETTDKERRRQYNRLERIYRQAGKTAPEFLRLEELDGLEGEQIGGLFLEGETGLLPGWLKPQAVERVGAVLSTRNRKDLQEACRLVQSVIDRAQPMMDDDPDEDQKRAVAILKTIQSKLEK
jgi:hypothetical protein